MPQALFYRDFTRMHGGHITFRSYFQFLKEAGFDSRVFFSSNSVFTPDNPWIGDPGSWADRWAPEKADLLMLGAMDWQQVPESIRAESRAPIIHLVTSQFTADPKHPSYAFLKYPAVRIAVTRVLAESLVREKVCRGPVYFSPDAIDFDRRHYADVRKDIPLLIVGLKEPALAERLASYFSDRKNLCPAPPRTVTANIPRNEYLHLVARAQVFVLLPRVDEGYCRSVVEGMAMGAVVVCPQCQGPEDYLVAGKNGLWPRYSEPEIIRAIDQALRYPRDERAALVRCALETADRESIVLQQQRFNSILKETLANWHDRAWRETVRGSYEDLVAVLKSESR